MKRHHWLLLGAVVLFLAAWLSWNALLVGQDVSVPAPAMPDAPLAR
jgi:hypothetical protein